MEAVPETRKIMMKIPLSTMAKRVARCETNLDPVTRMSEDAADEEMLLPLDGLPEA